MPFNYEQNFNAIQADPRVMKGASKSPFSIAGQAMTQLNDAIDDRAFERDISSVKDLSGLSGLTARTAKQQALMQQKQGYFSALAEQDYKNQMLGMQQELQPFQVRKMESDVITSQLAQNEANRLFGLKNEAQRKLTDGGTYNPDKFTLQFGKDSKPLQQGVSPTGFNKLSLTDRIASERQLDPKGQSATFDLMKEHNDLVSSRSSTDRDSYVSGDVVNTKDGYMRTWVNKYDPTDVKYVPSSLEEYNKSRNGGKGGESYRTLNADEVKAQGLDAGKVWQVGLSSNKISELGDAQAPITKMEQEKKASLQDDANVVLKNVNSMQAMLSDGTFGETGVGGKVMQGLGYLGVQSDRIALQGYLKNIVANLGFDKLQQMRDLSPTGGALGQVTEIELELLQSAVANIDFDAPDWKIKESLDDVEYKYTKIVHGREYADKMKKEKLDGGKSKQNNSNKPSAKEIGFSL